VASTINSMTSCLNIRPATIDDLQSVVALWSSGQKLSIGFVPEEFNVEPYFEQILLTQGERFRIWVAIDSSGEILGWQSLMPCRNNPALRDSFAESSTYVDTSNKVRAVKVMVALIQHAMSHADTANIRYILGFVAESNKTTIRIVEREGWQRLGSLPTSHLGDCTPSVALYVRQKGLQ
jgi:L-amino acid N-acyltransferase YncA